MNVQVTLYKTKFDAENIFVGASKAQRESVFANWSAEDKKILPLSSFNPDFPFRIAGNFLEYDRIYNYACYEYYDGATVLDKRYYFVSAFEYVNDNVTNMIVSEDLFGSRFWDLKYSKIIPNRYTYKTNIVGIKYNPISITDTAIVEADIDTIATVGNTDNEVGLGIIVVSSTSNNPTNDDKTSQTKENGFEYPIITYFYPFAFNKKTKALLSYNYYLSGTGEGRDIHGFYEGYNFYFANLLKRTAAGEKNISTTIILNLKGIINATVTTSGNITLSSSIMTLGKATTPYDKYGIIKSYSLRGYGYTPLINLKPYIENKTIDNNRINITIQQNGKEIQLDTGIFSCQDSDYLELTYMQSFLPPYNTIVYLVEPNSSDWTVDIIQNKYLSFENSGNFFDYSDAYSDWVRSNWNSTVMGLNVKQQSERSIFELNRADKIFNTLLGGVTGGISTGATSMSKSPIIRATAPIQGINVGKNLITNSVSMGIESANFSTNQAKEQALLKLQIQDIKNTPPQIAFNGSIDYYLMAKNYLRVIIKKNIAYDEINLNYKMYGYESPIQINSLQSHTIFDYVRATDIVLNNDVLYLSEGDRVSVEDILHNGVRVWYDIDNFKNFEVDNKEVTL